MVNVFAPRTPRTRLPDWEQRLFTWLNDLREGALVFGENDCAIGLIGGAVLSQTGVDIAEAHRGRYSDEKAAYDYLSACGWENLEAMADGLLTRVKGSNRHRGNIVLLESSEGQAFGVRVGAKAIAYAKDGIREFSVPRSAKEWTPL